MNAVIVDSQWHSWWFAPHRSSIYTHRGITLPEGTSKNYFSLVIVTLSCDPPKRHGHNKVLAVSHASEFWPYMTQTPSPSKGVTMTLISEKNSLEMPPLCVCVCVCACACVWLYILHSWVPESVRERERDSSYSIQKTGFIRSNYDHCH